MWTNMEPYVYIYLAGCVCYLVLMPIALANVYLCRWISRDNIFFKNYRKVQDPKKKESFKDWILALVIAVFESLLSWINVAVALWKIALEQFRVLRYFFTSVPEEVKALRFPLKHNPDMSRESVFAYLAALGVKNGADVPNVSSLMQELNVVYGYYKSFDRISALKQLDGLHIISSEVISNSLKQLQSADKS